VKKSAPPLQEEIKLKAELARPLADLQAAARAIGEVQRECGLDVDTDAYVESFRPALMDIIHAWSLVRFFSWVGCGVGRPHALCCLFLAT
jgi:ATP-dependent RNA helicase DOB1